MGFGLSRTRIGILCLLADSNNFVIEVESFDQIGDNLTIQVFDNLGRTVINSSISKSGIQKNICQRGYLYLDF